MSGKTDSFMRARAAGGFAHPALQLRVRNFKSIESASVNLAGLTAIVGANSAGKSSLIQALLVMAQSAEERSQGALVPLVGNKVVLGSFRDVLHTGARQSDPIELGITCAPSSTDDEEKGVGINLSSANVHWDVRLRAAKERVSSFAQIDRVALVVELDHGGSKNSFEVEALPERGLDSRPQLVPLRRGHHLDRRKRHQGGFPKRKIRFVELTGGIPLRAFRSLELWELVFEQLTVLVRENPALMSKLRADRKAARETTPDDCFKAVGALLLQLIDGYSDDELADLVDPQKAIDGYSSIYGYTRYVVSLLSLDDELKKTAVLGITHHAKAVRDLLRNASSTDFKQFRDHDREELAETGHELGAEEQAAEDSERWRTSVVYYLIGDNYHDQLRASRGLGRLLDRVWYLGPLRSSPSRRSGVGKSRRDIGSSGEYAFAVLHFNRSETIVPPAGTSEELGENPTLGAAVNEWLSFIGVASSVSTVDDSKDGFGLVARREFGGREFDLTEVGVGVSQVLPVVLTCLMARPGEIVILEQPELHLHPSMQIRLAEFLLACVKSGRQVIVETHSEYLVNRLRRHAVEESESSELVKLVFAEQDSKGVTRFRESAIDSDGGLSEDWPSGFLDVASDEAFRLLSAHLDKDPTS